ncbi:MAG: hypothetical protein ACJ8AO_07985 [Gemmatimonadaceae bacterium]
MADADKDIRTNKVIHHDDHPGVGDHVGEAAGGISGVLAGAAIGSAGGPIGTLIGGIVGAMGGWWTGRAVSEAATNITHADDDYYRSHYERSSNRLADRSYEQVRPAYHFGHLASHNPDYKDRDWEYVERDLQKGWASDTSGKYGEWTSMRDYAREGFTRGRSTYGTTRATTERPYYGAGTAAAGMADRAGDAAANFGHRAANAADSVKDRIDGNPASRPGPDPTDRRF